MFPYTLDKIYCDADLPAEGHLLVYLTRVRLGPMLDCRWHVVLSRRGAAPRQEIRVTRSLGLPARTRFATSDGQFECVGRDAALRLDGDRASVHLHYHNDHDLVPDGEFAVGAAGRRRVIWTPLMVRARVAGSATVHGHTVSIDRTVGYVDHVRSTLYPWRVPIRRLFWGRSYHDRLALTYTIAQLATGTTTALLVAEGAERSLRFTDVELEPIAWQAAGNGSEPDLESYSIRARGDGAELVLTVQHESLAVASDFIDDAGPLHPFSRWALEWISLRPRGTKHFASARLALSGAGQTELSSTGPAFVEQVRIG